MRQTNTLNWLKAVVGAILLVAGVRWVAVGLDVLPGGAMTGQPAWAAIGLAMALLGGWLLWMLVRPLLASRRHDLS